MYNYIENSMIHKKISLKPRIYNIKFCENEDGIWKQINTILNETGNRHHNLPLESDSVPPKR